MLISYGNRLGFGPTSLSPGVELRRAERINGSHKVEDKAWEHQYYYDYGERTLRMTV